MHDVVGKSHWHEPTANQRAGFGKWGRVKTPYDLFMESEEIPCFRDIGIGNVQTLPLKPWKRKGGKGTYIRGMHLASTMGPSVKMELQSTLTTGTE